ncbi:MAG: hypothetical protein L0G69_02900 [Brevibacterium sp.]|uniref:hypothetical protein n=1 Tax=Brevibacterium sandarakinum TaxID=629680 RepID=UPI0026506A4E|nr:hypothetical protein [Brevibacterium sandarakinum]MDN5585490.1 hypothetical protein [Brevibacterium sp.]MDN5657420.1 hypothetical protein [Brevibacterium sandarakinum]
MTRDFRQHTPAAELLRNYMFSGSASSDELLYERPLPGGAALRFRLTGLLDDEIHLQVNPAYAQIVKYRLMNLHSARYILSDLVTWRFLHAGLIPLYCSAFTHERAGTFVVMAPSHTGKTVTVNRACTEFGARLISEDLAVVDGSRIHSVPWTFSEHRHDNLLTAAGRVLSRRANSPEPPNLAPASPSAALRNPSPINDVIFLEKNAQTAVRPLSVDEGLRRALNLNRHSLHYAESPTLLAASYFNPSIDLSDAMMTERTGLEAMLSAAQNIWSIRAPLPTDFLDLVPGFAETAR